MVDYKETSKTSKTTKHIFNKKGGWIFIIFWKRVFDVTKIIQKIKNIELIYKMYFPDYEPIMILNRRHIISNGREHNHLEKKA